MKVEQRDQFCEILAQIAPDVKIEKQEGSAINRTNLKFSSPVFISGYEFQKVNDLINALNLHFTIEANMMEGIHLSVY